MFWYILFVIHCQTPIYSKRFFLVYSICLPLSEGFQTLFLFSEEEFAPDAPDWVAEWILYLSAVSIYRTSALLVRCSSISCSTGLITSCSPINRGSSLVSSCGSFSRGTRLLVPSRGSISGHSTLLIGSRTISRGGSALLIHIRGHGPCSFPQSRIGHIHCSRVPVRALEQVDTVFISLNRELTFLAFRGAGIMFAFVIMNGSINGATRFLLSSLLNWNESWAGVGSECLHDKREQCSLVQLFSILSFSSNWMILSTPPFQFFLYWNPYPIDSIPILLSFPLWQFHCLLWKHTANDKQTLDTILGQFDSSWISYDGCSIRNQYSISLSRFRLWLILR